MKIAITGGTGFVGSHLARELIAQGHEVVLLARGQDTRSRPVPGTTVVRGCTSDPAALAQAFAGCTAVAHCAGINRETGRQTYQRIHVEGTHAVVAAAQAAGVARLVLLSFIRARPGTNSGYHQSKWQAEQIVAGSGLDYTIIKAGMMYGRGDHMLDHLSHALHTFPVFGLVGFKQALVRPTAIEDAVRVLVAALVDPRLARATVALLGPETMTLEAAVRRVAAEVGRTPLLVRMPVFFHLGLARVCEWTMKVPMVARAQVRMLVEGMTGPLPGSAELPADLQPRLHFTPEQIRKGLPGPARFGWRDCRCLAF